MARRKKTSTTFRAFLFGLLLGLGAWVALDGLDVVRARIFAAEIH